MLDFHPGRRSTAAQCLEHPWLAEAPRAPSSPPPCLPTEEAAPAEAAEEVTVAAAPVEGVSGLGGAEEVLGVE